LVVASQTGAVAPMCNRYVSPAAADIERIWGVGGRNAPKLPSPVQVWHKAEVNPRAPGAFIRRHPEAVTPASAIEARELVVGQWGLIPWFAKTPELKH